MGQKQLSASRVVTISIPASVAYNLDAMNKVTAQVAGRLGCGECHSGFDFRFLHVLDFVVNDAGEVRERLDVSRSGVGGF
jgi:hypothetical protein